MALHPLAATFGAVADSYERGRPDYPPAVVGAIAAELGLAPDAQLLDLAAGTGKLTRALVAAGFEVVAVEPQPELRARLEAFLPAERIHDGTAEAIPLADGSVDAVTVADGFHWFNAEEALEELRRVLRSGGGIALITTFPEWNALPFADEFLKLISEERPDHPFIDGPPWSDAVAAARGWADPREIRVISNQPCNPEQLLEHVRSMSWIAALPESEREARIEKVEELVAGETMPADLPVHSLIGLASLA